MSYTVSFYLLEIEQLKRIIGNGEVSLIEETKVDTYKCGYVLEKIVAKIAGKRENMPQFEDLHFREFSGIMKWICLSGPPVSLPEYDGYPFIGHLHLVDIRQTLSEWNENKFDDYENEEQGMLEEMLDVFQKAIEKKKDLIAFYY